MGKISSLRRPEHSGAAENFYDENESRKYTGNSHMITIQSEMAERCLELLALPDDAGTCMLLDIGCGSGISGDVLAEHGHNWIGMDISSNMLDVALERDAAACSLLLADMGQCVPLRAGTLDGAISVSALQWLCNADTKEHNPVRRLYRFFASLYAALNRGTRAVFQFYPENDAQVDLITRQAIRAGFTGGLVVDHPNSTKAKKVYLVLFTGGQVQRLPPALGTGAELPSAVTNTNRDRHDGSFKHTRKSTKPIKKSKEWIVNKKEHARTHGDIDVRPDSKYTGRKRNRF